MYSIFSNIIWKSFFAMGQIGEVFGTPVKPPGPSFTNPLEGISRVMVFGLRFTIIIAFILALIYLLWGATDWIISNGEEEKLAKARQKMTNAALGIVILVAVIGIFVVISDDVLGIIQKDSQGNWQFSLPTLKDCAAAGERCTEINDCCTGTCPITVNSPFGTCP